MYLMFTFKLSSLNSETKWRPRSNGTISEVILLFASVQGNSVTLELIEGSCQSRSVLVVVLI